MALVADTAELPRFGQGTSRGALPLSVLIHGILLAAALLLLEPQPQPSPDLESISVSVIIVENTSDPSPAARRSDAAQRLLAAGAVAPVRPIPAEAEVTLTRVVDAPVERPSPASAPLENAAEPTTSSASDPQRSPSEAPPPDPPAKPPKPKPVAKPNPIAKPKPATSGSGGKSDANAAASSAPAAGKGKIAAGGIAAESRYPGLVQAALRRALRFPANAGNARGQALVRFLVAANGSVSGIAIVGSSGSSVLDQAAIDTVRRAAPFPRIPREVGRSSWSFTLPLQFRR